MLRGSPLGHTRLLRAAALGVTVALAAGALLPATSRAAPISGAVTTYAGGLGQGTPTNVGQQPMAIAVSGTKVFVADHAFDVVRAFDTSTNPVTETIVAGTGTAGYSGDDGDATEAQLALSSPTEPTPLIPNGLAVDASGNLYIADTYNNVVREVDHATHVITTVVGDGTAAFSGDNGPATSAELDQPSGLAIDPSGNLYIADAGNCRVRKVLAGFGLIVTVAGSDRNQASGCSNSSVGMPTGVALDSAGDLFVADQSGCAVREVPPSGSPTLDAGSGSCGYSGEGTANSSALNHPSGVAVDIAGNLLIADTDNCLVRKVAADGSISTYAGTPPAADGFGGFGSPVCGFAGDKGPATGTGSTAQLSHPYAVVTSGTSTYVADTENNALRRVVSGNIDTVAGAANGPAENGTVHYSGDGGPVSAAELNQPQGITADSGGNLFVADPSANVVRKIDTNGTISTVAGTGEPGSSGDGGPATSAKLNGPSGVAVDGQGNLYIADTGNCVIRKVSGSASTSTISTIAGVAGKCHDESPSYTGPEIGDPTKVELNHPTAVTLDPTGTVLYIADTGSSVVRRQGLTTNVTAPWAGHPGMPGYGGDTEPATNADVKLNLPEGVAVDAPGNLYIADTSNKRIRRVDANPPYTITTVAGANSELDGPYGIALDQNSGDLYIADTLSNTIRFVDATSHNISTLAGDGNEGYADGAPASAEFNLPRGVALAGGNLYITDFENSVVRRLGPAPPGKPKNVAATAGNSSAHVSWDAPDFDGGSPITGYTVTGDPGGTTVTVGGDATSADVNGLTNGTSYTFTVTAANAIGTGPSSDPSNAITAGNNTVSRLAGDDRIGTAIAVSKTAFSAPGSADAVVLATAYDYPDALAGTPLAAAKHAPLLLSGADQLDQQTKVEIQRVLTAGKTVYLLGGPVALNGAVEDQVRSMGYATTRYAGGNRYQTAVAIADQGLANPSTLLLATGTNFADALSGSAAAAVAKAAILLTDGSTMAPDTASYLGQHAGAKTYALGGPAAAADPSATPIVGADRYDTSAHVASQFFDAPKVVGVATGINYPDALSGGAQMGMQAGPMLLTLPDSLPKPVSSYCAAKKDSIDGAFIYGGTLAVHDSVSADVGVAIT